MGSSRRVPLNSLGYSCNCSVKPVTVKAKEEKSMALPLKGCLLLAYSPAKEEHVPLVAGFQGG